MTILNTSKWLLKKVHRLFFLLFLSFYAPIKLFDQRGNGAALAIALLSTALALYSTLLCNVAIAHIALKTDNPLAQDVNLHYTLYAVAVIGFTAFFYTYLAEVVSQSDLSTVKFGWGMTSLLALFCIVFYFTAGFVTIVY